jgi:hypothetical protein
MDKLWFSSPVKVWPKPGRGKNVSHVEQAAEVMLYDWPEEWKTAASLRAAKKACLSALEGVKTPEDARKAFEKAARDARILGK